jgi:hypothetical protein
VPIDGVVGSQVRFIFDRDTGDILGYKNPVTDLDQELTLGSSGGEGGGSSSNTSDVILARPLRTRGSRERFTVNGNTTDVFPARMQVHDLAPASGSLVNPVSGRANFSLLNVGQPLTPAVGGPPYWTDPGALLYTVTGASDGFIPENVPGLIEFLERADGVPVAQFTCPPGYGEGAAGNGSRRTQLQSAQITTRRRVAWRLKIIMPSSDAAPYDVATGYNFPLLFWQLKTDNSQPMWTAVVVTTSTPNVYQLRIGFLYSDDESDAGTHRRQVNDDDAGSFNNDSSTTVVTALFNREEYQDLVIEMYLDERDVTTAAGGEGYAVITLNGETLAQWSGPTVAYKDIDGNLPAPPRWSLGPYLYASSVPAGLEQLDLDRAVDPSPNYRCIQFAEACLYDLDVPPRQPAPSPPPLVVSAGRALTSYDNDRDIEVTTGLTITVPDTLSPNTSVPFRCRFLVRSGTLTLDPTGSATLNGGSGNLTRAATQVVELVASGNTALDFFVSGS